MIPNSNTNSSSGIYLFSSFDENEFSSGKAYIISAWVKSNTNANVDISYQINGEKHYGVARNFHSGSGEWELLRAEATIPNNYDWIKFHLQVPGVGSPHNNYAYFDDVRIYPGNGLGTSYTYDPATLQISSISDENSIPQYFEFDGFGRLIRQRDPEMKIKAEYSYYFSRTGNNDQFNNADPNFVESVIYPDGVPTDSLIGMWRFEDDYEDESGKDHAMHTAENAHFVSGMIGRAVNLNNEDTSYINLGDIDELDAPGYFTLALWFKRKSDINDPTNHNINNILMAKSSQAANDNLEIGTDGTNVEIYIDSQSGLDGVRSYNAGIQDNVWYHLALTYDRDDPYETKLYLNGELVQQWADWSGSLDDSYTAPVTLGAARPDRNIPWGKFNGVIDEVKIYTRALSAEEVKALYNAGIRTTFFDGLGREIQIQESETPTTRIVQGIVYDAKGRTAVLTLPVKSDTVYRYLSDLLPYDWEPGTALTGGRLLDYYRNNLGFPDVDASFAYTYTTYYNDPLDRVHKIGNPGDVFKIPPGDSVEGSQTLHEIVNVYSINGNGDPIGEFGAGEFTGRLIIDENGHETLRYEDGFGNKRVEVVTMGSDPDLMTAFDYDILGNLVRVRPPNYFSPPPGSTGNGFMMTYKYNTLGQLLEKTTPDDGTTRYRYDAAGNPRLIRDANHQVTGTNAVNIFREISSAYEGRFVINKNGILIWKIVDIGTSGAQEFRFTISTTDGIILVDKTFFVNSSQSISGKITLSPRTYLYKIERTSGTGSWTLNVSLRCLKAFQYVYQKFDPLGRIVEIGEYDGYTAFHSADVSTTGDPSVDFPGQDGHALITYRYGPENGYSGARFLEGRLAKVSYVDQNNWKTYRTYYSYNKQGLVEWIVHEIPDLGTKKIEYEYNLRGDVTHMVYQRGAADEWYLWYEYDGLGRVTKLYSGSTEDKSLAKLEAEYRYTADSKYAEVNLGVETGTGGSQSIDYSYNIRGWLTAINDPNNLNEATNGFPDDRFAMAYGYHSSLNTDSFWKAQYNGNISQLQWRVDPIFIDPDNPLYTFQYDRASRLILANYNNLGNAGDNNNSYDVRNIRYDGNGNFLRLVRYGESGNFTDMNYSYYSGTNRLKNVDGSGEDYGYDANGNGVKDVNRGIDEMVYDHRNLPYRMFINGKMIQHVYDAEGRRVKKDFNEGEAFYYIRGVDGEVLVVYNRNGEVLFWNLLVNSQKIGKVIP